MSIIVTFWVSFCDVEFFWPQLTLPIAIGSHSTHMPFIDFKAEQSGLLSARVQPVRRLCIDSSRHRLTREGFVLEPAQNYDVKGNTHVRYEKRNC